MILAETDRLILRTLEKNELPRLVSLLDVWEVVRWLAVVPFPYTMRHAEEFFSDMEESNQAGEPQFYAMALKTDNLLIGGVGLHPPRGSTAVEGEVEIGYWLGKDFWGNGFTSEAAREVLKLAFAKPDIREVIATTAPNNLASQNVLRKLGLYNRGLVPCDYAVLRGGEDMIKWSLTRTEYEAGAFA